MDPNKKNFRPTPARFQNSLKILSGTKTNATIRDLEEDEDELEEKEGIVVSISRDKINGAGWTVKDEENNLYTCSCASSMYELPQTTERHGILYPEGQVKVKFTVNPVLRINTITEIISLGQGEEKKLDISKWKHEDEATTVIAKPKSAISISDSKISFSYDNINEVVTDDKAIALKGEETKIESNKVNIDAEEINMQGLNINDFIGNITIRNTINNSKLTSYTGGVTPFDASSVFLTQERNLVSMTIDGREIYLDDKERVMADIKDPHKHPLREQKFILLTDKGMDTVKIYPDGIVTFKSNTESGERNILSTHNFLAPQFDKRHVIQTTASPQCPCCSEVINGQIFIDYCPVCQQWHVLSQIQNNIICNHCNATFCASCGHYNSAVCSDKEFDLKVYDKYSISTTGQYCGDCDERIEQDIKRTYINYCPKCNKWNFLNKATKNYNRNNINILRCNYCYTDFCANCGTEQNDYQVISFQKNIIYYGDYLQKNRKLFFVE